jgi:hypothetical protein
MTFHPPYERITAHPANPLTESGPSTQIDDPRLGLFIAENELAWFTGEMPPEAR